MTYYSGKLAAVLVRWLTQALAVRLPHSAGPRTPLDRPLSRGAQARGVAGDVKSGLLCNLDTSTFLETVFLSAGLPSCPPNPTFSTTHDTPPTRIEYASLRIQNLTALEQITTFPSIFCRIA